MDTPLANYHAQRQAFLGLFENRCDNRILLLKGASGSGKTSLLQNCLRDAPLPLVNIQLRGSAVSVAEIFSRTAKRIGWDKLVNFNHCAADFAAQSPQIRVDGVHQQGEANNVRVALNVQDLGNRDYRQTALTDAWFEDVARLDEPLVMALDTYEQADAGVQDWLSGPFLVRTADCEQVRVTVAGQCVPEPGIEWDHCHCLYELYGVREARHWLPVVEGLGKQVPSANPLDWLAGICYALNGRPADIMDVIKKLPNVQSAQ